jgi:glycosyltransferase involved in cell wall biosynthesis
MINEEAVRRDVSVIICSHNPRTDFLWRTLEALKAQTLELERWELLLIDNASKAGLAETWDLSWQPHARHILEINKGLSAARLRAMEESVGNLLVFIDDDNVLDPSYLSEALRIGRKWPQLGAWGAGNIIPEFEVQPADAVRSLTRYLALRETTGPRWSNVVSCWEATPWGAGLCIRSVIAAEYRKLNVRSDLLIFGRQGDILMGGEDVEIARSACRAGLGMGIFPQLKLTHLVSKERVSRKYLLKIYEGTTTTNLLLAYKWEGKLPETPCGLWGLLSIIKNFLTRRGLTRRIYLSNLRALRLARRIIASTALRPNFEEPVNLARKFHKPIQGQNRI